jgi:hypothetical protein
MSTRAETRPHARADLIVQLSRLEVSSDYRSRHVRQRQLRRRGRGHAEPMPEMNVTEGDAKDIATYLSTVR